MGKTLIIQNLQGIGDTVWFIRHYHAIAKATQDKKVSILTRSRSMADQILQYDPFIEQVLWLDIKPGRHDGLWGIVLLSRLICHYKFEKVWILHSRSLRYALACRLAGVPVIYGPGIGLQKYLLRKSVPLSKEEQTMHPIGRGTALLKRNGLTLDQEKAPLFVGEKVPKEIKKYPKPWVGLGIASSEPHKKWSWEKYVSLGIALHKQQGGTLFIMGGGLENNEAQKMMDSFRQENIDSFTATNLPITQSLALLQQLDFIVGNDTGILHAAPMVATPGLVLLGKSQVPIHQYAEVEGLQFDHKSINEITVEMVLEKIKMLGWV